MAIKIRKEDKYVYKASGGILSTPEKHRADLILKDATDLLASTKQHSKDALGIWHKRGLIANKLIKKYNLDYEERRYFWVMLYDALSVYTPKKSHAGKNDFWTATILSDYKLNDLRKVGSWALWREVLGSSSIKSDARVASWVTKKIIKDKISRDNSRPLLKYVRNRLKGIDTTVLSKAELHTKLDSKDWGKL